METRKDLVNGAYGRGNTRQMAFGAFLQRLAHGDRSLYMTTQTLPKDEEGNVALFGPPLTKLAGDFPLRPRLAGNLVPHNINVWWGHSGGDGEEGVEGGRSSSSGLHHDYHDNLYLVVKGRWGHHLCETNFAISTLPSHLTHLLQEAVPVVFSGVGATDAHAWQHSKGAR